MTFPELKVVWTNEDAPRGSTVREYFTKRDVCVWAKALAEECDEALNNSKGLMPVSLNILKAELLRVAEL